MARNIEITPYLKPDNERGVCSSMSKKGSCGPTARVRFRPYHNWTGGARGITRRVAAKQSTFCLLEFLFSTNSQTLLSIDYLSACFLLFLHTLLALLIALSDSRSSPTVITRTFKHCTFSLLFIMRVTTFITAAVAAAPMAVSAAGKMGYAIGVKHAGISLFWYSILFATIV